LKRSIAEPFYHRLRYVLAMPTLSELTATLRAFVAERDWQQFHDPKNLAMLVASEAGELVAEYRWVRGDDADARSREPAARARIADEVADVGIALLLLCDRIGLDLTAAMEAKIATNAARYPVEASRGRSERKI
jgi:NTP pyrophosphatase (non-canonical NTP hydrolase)